jgi:glycogen debranching enzyme
MRGSGKEEAFQKEYLWNLGLETIRELEVENGILASGKEEIYGCIFGRDSLITALKLLRVYDQTQDTYFLHLVKKILVHLLQLQGKEVNIESGEEPGKCIHEFRPAKHEHLTGHPTNPWYLYPDNIMRNYDTVDATPLLLIALYRYIQKAKDEEFVNQSLANIRLGLDWIFTYGDSNNDGLIDYHFNPNRKYSGLVTQSWMDSTESVFHEDGSPVIYPVAPVEVQAYAYLALKLWSSFFSLDQNPIVRAYATTLGERALVLKTIFNQKFFVTTEVDTFIACGIDGSDNPLISLRSSIGHCLWASLTTTNDGTLDCIVRDAYIPLVVEKLMSAELFEKGAGIRTLGKNSTRFEANSYHNGSIWPHDTSLIAEGLDLLGYGEEAKRIRESLLQAITHFASPVELFVYDDGGYEEYCSPHGQKACRKQAWSAASILEGTVAL